MSKFKDKRPPQLLATSTPEQNSYDDAALEGVAANVKLLLKLIQDHKEACKTQRNDGRRMLRVAGMMTILDMVRTRIQNCQSFGTKRPNGLGPFGVQSPKDKPRSTDSLTADDQEKLKRELSANLAARKSLEIMCSGLGKEKDIMMRELAKKAHELSEMEEHINDLKAQNETLLEKVSQCAQMHKHDEKESLDEYRLMKRKVKEVQEENMAMHATMEEMGSKVGTSLDKIRTYRQHLNNNNGDEIVDIEEGILELEHMFKCFEKKTAHS